MKYTAEEVRAIAKRLHDDITVADGDALMASDMLTAYADLLERIKASEGVVTDAVVQRAEQAFWPAYSECKRVHEAQKDAHATGMRSALLAVWPNPPAQAAQVDPAAKPRTLADFVNAPDAERAQIGQQVATRVDEMMAEPVAQPADSGRAAVGMAGTMPGTDGFTMALFKSSDVPVGTELYTAPPAQPAERVPEGLPYPKLGPEQEACDGYVYECGYTDGWNACRDAMLASPAQPAQSVGVEPVAWLCDNGASENLMVTLSPRGRDAYAALGRTITPLYTHPAPPIDLAAVREVIASHINEAKNLRHDPELQDYLYEQADKLKAALQERGNG